MTISIENLSLEVQQFIQSEIAAGNYRTPEELVESVLAQAAHQRQGAQSGSSQISANRRPLTRGILAHVGVDLSFDEIEEASEQACGNFPRDFPEED